MTGFLTQLLGQGRIHGEQGATPSAMTTSTFRPGEGHSKLVPEEIELLWLPQGSRLPEGAGTADSWE